MDGAYQWRELKERRAEENMDGDDVERYRY